MTMLSMTSVERDSSNVSSMWIAEAFLQKSPHAHALALSLYATNVYKEVGSCWMTQSVDARIFVWLVQIDQSFSNSRI
jgi:hypothetical protein